VQFSLQEQASCLFQVPFEVSFQVRSFARIPFSQHLSSLGAWLCFLLPPRPNCDPFQSHHSWDLHRSLLAICKSKAPGSFHPRAVRLGKFHPFPIWTPTGMFMIQGVLVPCLYLFSPLCYGLGLWDVQKGGTVFICSISSDRCFWNVLLWTVRAGLIMKLH
jgi:hypothetical protein